MSEKERTKKDGRTTDKQTKALRESGKERQHSAQPPHPSSEQPEMAAGGEVSKPLTTLNAIRSKVHGIL